MHSENVIFQNGISFGTAVKSSGTVINSSGIVEKSCGIVEHPLMHIGSIGWQWGWRTSSRTMKYHLAGSTSGTVRISSGLAEKHYLTQGNIIKHILDNSGNKTH